MWGLYRLALRASHAHPSAQQPTAPPATPRQAAPGAGETVFDSLARACGGDYLQARRLMTLEQESSPGISDTEAATRAYHRLLRERS